MLADMLDTLGASSGHFRQLFETKSNNQDGRFISYTLRTPSGHFRQLIET